MFVSKIRLVLITGFTVLSVGCAGTPEFSVLDITRTGGDFADPVRVDVTGNPNKDAIDQGDVVVVSPGALRSVVESPPLFFTLVEPASKTRKALQINPRDYAKIEVMRGIFKKTHVLSNVYVNMANPQENSFKITLLAFNRSKKSFRGDLTIYDHLPSELKVESISEAAYYKNQEAAKGAINAVPVVGWMITASMPNIKRTNEQVNMSYSEVEPGLYKFDIPRVIIEPGRAVGLEMEVSYIFPEEESLDELREYASQRKIHKVEFDKQRRN